MAHPDLPDTLWHGTSLASARLIARSGLLLSSKRTGGFGNFLGCPGVHLSDSRDVALHFARIAARHQASSPVLLAVPSAALDPAHLAPDAFLMLAPARRPLFYGAPRPVDDEAREAWFARAEQESWQDSLAKVSGVVSTVPVPLADPIADVSVLPIPAFASDEDAAVSETGGWPGGHVIPATPVFERVAPPNGPALGTLLEPNDSFDAESALVGWAVHAMAALCGIAPEAIRMETPEKGGKVLKAPLHLYRAKPLLPSLEALFGPWNTPVALTGRRTPEGHHGARVFMADRIWMDPGENGRFGKRLPGLCVSYHCARLFCSDARVQEARATAAETVGA